MLMSGGCAIGADENGAEEKEVKDMSAVDLRMIFSDLTGQANGFLDEAEIVAYGGLADSKTPDMVMSELSAIRKYITYVFLLGCAIRDLCVDDRDLLIQVTSGVKRMEEQVCRVERLHAWLKDVLDKSEKRFTEPVEL